VEHDAGLHSASMEVYDKFVEIWDHASVSMRQKSASIVDEDLQNGVIALTERIASTLQDVIDDLQVVQSLDSHITILGDVNQTLINFIMDQARRSVNKDTGVTFQPTAQSALSAAVLKTIRDHQVQHDRGIPLAQLKTSIGQFASSLSFSEAQGTQAIYMLVANGLVSIDRNEKGSPVKLV
jgi:vacuolar-type H+-ATPase subunit F/Vma7